MLLWACDCSVISYSFFFSLWVGHDNMWGTLQLQWVQAWKEIILNERKTQSSSLLQKSKGQRVSGFQPYKVIFIRKPTKRTLFTSFFPLFYFLYVHMLCMSCVYLIDNDWLNHGTVYPLLTCRAEIWKCITMMQTKAICREWATG